MELFLFRHSEYERLYNCSGFDINAIPLDHRRFVPESIILILLTTFYYILYIPCLISIWKHLGDSTCYKLLFFIGIMDLGIMWIIGILHGFLSLGGAVFCSHPTLIYFTGIVAISGWVVESTADVLLAVDRCLETLAPHLSRTLFHGHRVLFWLGLCCLYGFYWVVFEKPLLFSGVYFTWFFDPFVGYRKDRDNKFLVRLHGIHDYSIGISMPLMYIAFVISFWYRLGHQQMNISRFQKMAFLQVFIFSAINSLGCYLYVLLQHVEVKQWMITLAQYNWVNIHGIPAIVYLLLNKTIRNDCLKMFYKVFDPKRISRIHGVTVLRGSRQNQVQPTGLPSQFNDNNMN